MTRKQTCDCAASERKMPVTTSNYANPVLVHGLYGDNAHECVVPHFAVAPHKKPLIYVCIEDMEGNRTAEMTKRFIESHAERHPELIFVSPIHAVGYLKGALSAERYAEYRLELLDMCDCMMTFGDNSESELCEREKEYATKHKIRIWDMLRERVVPEPDQLRIGEW